MRKRKCRIKLNDIINEKLDLLEDDSSLKVFEPKVSSQSQFLELVNIALEEENLSPKEKQNRDKRLKRNSSGEDGVQSSSMIAVITLSLLFVLFVFSLWFIIF